MRCAPPRCDVPPTDPEVTIELTLEVTLEVTFEVTLEVTLRVTPQALAVSDVMGEAKVDDNGELGTARYKVLQALDMRHTNLTLLVTIEGTLEVTNVSHAAGARHVTR